MHILVIHQFFLQDIDAGGSRWNEMSRIWIEKGHEVTVLTGTVHYMGHGFNKDKNQYFSKNKNKDGVTVIHCFVSESYHSGFFGRLHAYLSFVLSGIWGGIFYAKGKYDLIIVTSPPLFVGITAIILSWFKSIPYVFEVRDLWPESAIETGILSNEFLIRFAYWFEKYVYRKAKMINVLTPAFRDVLTNKKNVPAEKIICISNASDFALADQISAGFDVSAFREELGLENKFVITYVGAHGVANHLMQIVDAAALLQDTNAYFLLIGAGSQKTELKAEVEKRQLSNIRFVDPVSKKEVFKYILASDMGTSVLKKAEIFRTIYSNKTFDYFSCKKPVLIAIDGISKQLVEDANAGVFIEPENSVDFADKVRHYISNSHLLDHQGKNGYHYAKAHFDRKELAEKYLNYIVDLHFLSRNSELKK